MNGSGLMRRRLTRLACTGALLTAAGWLSAQDAVAQAGEPRQRQEAGLAVAHVGSTDMVTFRYRLKDVAMQVAEEAFTAAGMSFPAGSFLVTGSAAELAAARALADSLGLTAASLEQIPGVDSHPGDPPRVAIYSQGTDTLDLRWYRSTFDRFRIPYDLIRSERVAQGNLRADYDVILMAAQEITRESVLPPERPEPQGGPSGLPGTDGAAPDTAGRFGLFGVAAIEGFLERGGTLIAAGSAVRFPIEFGFARTVDTEAADDAGPLNPPVRAAITRTDHPVFYGYADSIFPIEYDRDAQVFSVGIADRDRILAGYVAADSSGPDGPMGGAVRPRERAFAVDVTNAHNGRGRVLLFANDPIDERQSPAGLNMVFNSLLNWDDVPRSARRVVIAERERPAMLPCPWPAPPETAPAPGAAGGQPSRSRIPDCVPPGWQPPVELEPYEPPPLPEDRPKPIVEDYLRYVVTEPPPEIVARYGLDTTFYRKYADANGYPILASAKVPDAALAIVRDQVNYLLAHRPDVRDTMVARGSRIVIMAETEYTMDIPEQRDWTVPKFLDPRLTAGERAAYYEPGGLGYRSPERYWNGRARGMGGTLTSCAEENVLGYYNTRYWGTNICIHEFSHAIMGAGIGNADPIWFQEIVNAYKAARAACRVTANGYAGNTFNEYWATGVEWYVGTGGRDRAALKAADPWLHDLIARLIPEDRQLPIRANVARRTRDEMAELVRRNNPDWWLREEQRIAAREAQARAERGEGRRPGAGGGTPSCTPS